MISLGKNLNPARLALLFALALACANLAVADPVTAGAVAPPVSFGALGTDPQFTYTFSIGPDMGTGSVMLTEVAPGEYLATSGTLTVTSSKDKGTYSLVALGPIQTTGPCKGVSMSAAAAFCYDDLVFPSSNPTLDYAGLLFSGSGLEINIFGNASNTPGNYEFMSYNGSYNVDDKSSAGTVNFTATPEPSAVSTLVLQGSLFLLVGLVGFGFSRKRRKAQVQP